MVLENISKIDKPLAVLAKKRNEKTQVTNIRNERRDITTELTEIKVSSYYEQLYANKLHNK